MQRRVAAFLAGGLVLLAAQVTLARQSAQSQAGKFVGKPTKFEKGEGKSCAVWFEDGWWHLVATSKKGGKGEGVTWTGTVRVEGDNVKGEYKYLNAPKKNAKTGDKLTVDDNGRGFRFKFYTNGGVDYVRFQGGPNATSIRIHIKVNGEENEKRILIGKKGFHPESAKFTVPVDPTK